MLISQLQECNAATIGNITLWYAWYDIFISYIITELQSPTLQAIILGENATFQCFVNNIQDYNFRWVYSNELTNGEHHIDYSNMSLEGITVETVRAQTTVSTLTIEGRKEFNNTEVYCSLWDFSGSLNSDSSLLIIIGKLSQ